MAGFDERVDLVEVRNRVSAVLNQLSATLMSRVNDLGNGGTQDNELDAETRALQARVGRLGQIAAGLATVDPDCLPATGAGYGSRVRVRHLDTAEQEEYTLMIGSLVDIEGNQVSLAAPIGQVLLGCIGGEAVTAETPYKRLRMRVESVNTLFDFLEECERA
jgi:transcription elongation GreA/GreB family factor